LLHATFEERTSEAFDFFERTQSGGKKTPPTAKCPKNQIAKSPDHRGGKGNEKFLGKKKKKKKKKRGSGKFDGRPEAHSLITAYEHPRALKQSRQRVPINSDSPSNQVHQLIGV